VWVPGAILLPQIGFNADLRNFSKNRSCRTFIGALLILRCRLSEHVEASDVTTLIYPVSSVSLTPALLRLDPMFDPPGSIPSGAL